MLNPESRFGSTARDLIEIEASLGAHNYKPLDVVLVRGQGVSIMLRDNGYAAKFSIPYAIAVGILRGDAGLAEYEDAAVHDPAVRARAVAALEQQMKEAAANREFELAALLRDQVNDLKALGAPDVRREGGRRRRFA